MPASGASWRSSVSCADFSLTGWWGANAVRTDTPLALLADVVVGTKRSRYTQLLSRWGVVSVRGLWCAAACGVVFGPLAFLLTRPAGRDGEGFAFHLELLIALRERVRCGFVW